MRKPRAEVHDGVDPGRLQNLAALFRLSQDSQDSRMSGIRNILMILIQTTTLKSS